MSLISEIKTMMKTVTDDEEGPLPIPKLSLADNMRGGGGPPTDIVLLRSLVLQLS